MYFIVFEAIVNASMGFFPDFYPVCSLLEYKKATNFCMLILYLANLLKEFVISNFFGRFFGRFFRIV
jgi:hypothetical protein